MQEHDSSFPVDFVFTWVDGNDPVWQARKNRAAGLGDSESASHEACRYANNNELLYAIRSVFTYCPWFNKIYIVTASQVPEWLNTSNERVVVVDHQDIFEDQSCLPTFNSNVIESRLHHIPGLSEHFVLLNDDFFFGRPLTRAFFFNADGSSKIFLSLPKERERVERLMTDESLAKQPQYLSTLNRTRWIVFKKTGELILNSPKHTPRPFCKTDMLQFEKEFDDVISAASKFQFRDTKGIYFLAMASFYLVAQGRAVYTIKMILSRESKEHLSKLDYIKISPHGSRKSWIEYLLLFVVRPGFFCINDNEKTTDKDRHLMVWALKRYLPTRCSAEK